MKSIPFFKEAYFPLKYLTNTGFSGTLNLQMFQYKNVFAYTNIYPVEKGEMGYETNQRRDHSECV